jgi:heme ABC exporter ATP-binding subunit CcmA
MPSHDGAPLLQARGLQRSFGRARILRGIDLELRPGEALALVGPNGAGKTTLLRLLAGLMQPTAGEIHVLGHPLKARSEAVRRAIGLLTHQSLLYDDLTLRENLVLAARLYELDQPRQVAEAALDATGLGERGSELPRRLSRGLLQRAALARAMLHSPSILLLDEPFTGLDAAAAERLRTDLRARLERGASIVVVTHQPAEVWDFSSRVAVLWEGRWAVNEPCAGSADAFVSRYRAMAGA